MVETVNPRQAAELIATPGLEIVDVRDNREWSASGHIPGARHVPLETLRADPDAVLARDHAVMFVCGKGVRSLAAAKLAERLGFDRVYSLEGGTKEWARAGLPLVAERASVAA